MKTTLILVLLSAILMVTLFPQSVFPLKCVICDNQKDKTGCGHGSDVDVEKHLKDCADVTDAEGGSVTGANFVICRKIITWIDFNVNNNTATERIVRKCGHITSKYDNECYYRGGFGGRQRVCSCTTDKCNSGFSFQPSHIFMTVASVMALLAAKL